eukprot:TRINITY_DN1935_c0_g1_i1.p1 TRINITY_DN1935_c0_g1~~TRINITY_DN1935_c0_g1_i1.p1  ORF type:complete len:709 (+),score=184.53 TRINITY_DN1935_c0_g1_i1:384-2510(+)
MSSGTVGVGAAQAAAVRDILGSASQDGRISKEHKKLIHEVRDFIRNNAAPERSSDYKAWEDLDILEVLQERAEPRMNAIAAALHILESGEKPEPWHQATSHRDHHSNTSAPSKRGGRGASRGGRRQENGSDQRRTSSPSNSQQRRDGRPGSPSATGRGGRGGARGGRAQSSSTHNNATSGAAHTNAAAQPKSDAQPAATSVSTPAASQPAAATAVPPTAAATKKPMNFAAAARSGTAAAVVASPAAAPASTPVTAPSSSAPKSKPAKRVAKKVAAPDHEETQATPSADAAPPAASTAAAQTPAASGWKPKRNVEAVAPESVAPAAAAVAELSLDDKSQQAKVRLPASLSTPSSTGIKFGGPRASSNPASTSTHSTPAPVAAEPAGTPVVAPAAATAAPVAPAEMPSLPMQLPPGMPPNFYYFYNFMQPGLQGPQAPAMMQPDYGLASAALYGAGHQQPIPMVEQASGQPAFSVNGLGMGSYPSQAPYGAYGGMPPTNMPSQYPQMGMLPPMGMGLPMNMLAAQTHPAAMQYQSMGQPTSMPPGYLQGAMQHAPASGNQGNDSMHHGGHQDALHHGNGMAASQLPFGGAQVSSPQDQHHMMMHPYAQMMPYPVPAHMQHGSVDLFPAGASANGASIFDQQQQQQRQSKATQQVTQQPPAQQPQVGSQAGVPSYSRSYVGAAQQTAQKQGPGAANNYPWGLQSGPTKSNQ